MKSDRLLMTGARPLGIDRAADFVELMKPRIAVLVLATVAVGAFAAARGQPDLVVLLNALVGTALVAGGAGAINQWWEHPFDARMPRTADRPIPAGRIAPGSALGFGMALASIGLLQLLLAASPQAALVALASLALYVAVYTPLKRRTCFNTVVGAVAGALPPAIGWAAMTGRLDPECWSLFAIVFFWQFPHFWAIAWLYRRDYALAGFCMLPTSAIGQRIVGLASVSYLLALLPASLAPTILGIAGPIYFWSALFAGLVFLMHGVAFLHTRSDDQARRLLWSSLVYLPFVLLLLGFDLLR